MQPMLQWFQFCQLPLLLHLWSMLVSLGEHLNVPTPLHSPSDDDTQSPLLHT
jgi:hypothetical protein